MPELKISQLDGDLTNKKRKIALLDIEKSIKGKADSGEYNKKTEDIKLNNISLNNKEISLNSKFISFNQKLGITDSDKVFIKDSAMKISGFNLKTDKNFNNLSLKKVKAEISY